MRRELIGARKASNLTQQQLADKAGVDRSHISHLECGSKDPSYPLATAIARILNVPVEDIFPPICVSYGHGGIGCKKPTGTTG